MTKPQPKFASASQISNSQILNPGTAAALEILPPVLPATHYSLPATLPIDLSASINAAFATARTAADSATHEARAAITAAVQCGDLLTRQKASVPHGTWLAWLAAHCPAISAETARRYMRLAKRSQVTDLTDATSLRQAYLATGVLPEPPPRDSDTPDANAPLVTFTRGLDQFRRWYHRRTDELPLAKWTPDARRLLRNELVWFKKLHDDLVA
jgi:hypothetical protein